MKKQILIPMAFAAILVSLHAQAETASCLEQAQARIGHPFQDASTVANGNLFGDAVCSPSELSISANDAQLDPDRKEVRAIVSESYVGAGEHLNAFLVRVKKVIPSLTFQEVTNAVIELNRSPNCAVDENLNKAMSLQTDDKITVDSMDNFTNQILAEIVLQLPRISPTDIVDTGWLVYYEKNHQ